MFFWLIILFILFSFSYMSKGRKTITFWGSIAALIFIAGFRDIYVGTDTIAYESFWETILRSGTSYMEFGWNFLGNIVAFFTDDYNLFLTFISAFTLGIAGYIWNRYSEDRQFSLFVYFAIFAYCGSLNIMRQYAAISILLLAYTFLYKQKKIVCAILILSASMIHTAAVFAMPVLLADKIDMRDKTFVLLAIVTTLLLGALPFIKNLSFLAGKFEHLFSQGNLYRGNTSVFVVLSSIYSLLFLYIYFNCDDVINKNVMLKIFFMGVLFFNIVCQLRLGTRLFYNYAIIQTLLLPKLLKGRNNAKMNIVLTSYLLLYCIIMLGRDAANVYPYVNVFYKYF